MSVRRRLVLKGLLLSLTLMLGLAAPPTEASTARALPLDALVKESSAVLVGTALDASSQWEDFAGSRRIVTSTRVRVEETLQGQADSEVLVRTLGGRVGDVGQIVHGEAVLVRGKRALLFLQARADGTAFVTGMAQGHFPIQVQGSSSPTLTLSPGLDHVVGEHSAAQRLNGQTLHNAAQLISKAAKP